MTKKTEQTDRKESSANESALEERFQISRIKEFAADVKREFGKIAWPQKKHTAASTLVVVVMVTLISLYLGVVDLVLGKVIGLVLK